MVATPLRLIDLIKSNEVNLDDIQIVTLDEADRMADDGFTPQVEWILEGSAPTPRELPQSLHPGATFVNLEETDLSSMTVDDVMGISFEAP